MWEAEMHYRMTTPCDQCPFLKGSGFKKSALEGHASGEFACHKACDIVDGHFEARSNETPHCAGALIYNERRDRPHQMMRIVERLGLYDRTRLNMDAPVQ
jgi:hypothetical protein